MSGANVDQRSSSSLFSLPSARRCWATTWTASTPARRCRGTASGAPLEQVHLPHLLHRPRGLSSGGALTSCRCWSSPRRRSPHLRRLRLQAHLPLNADHQRHVKPRLAWNTAVSFGTNTDWQNYVGEATMSHLSQMFGSVFHLFMSAAVGMALAVAFIRGLTRRRPYHASATSGSTRSVPRLGILIPLAFVFAFVFMSQGVIQNFHAIVRRSTSGRRKCSTVRPSNPGGPVASQWCRWRAGDNGGGPPRSELGATRSRTRTRSPTSLSCGCSPPSPSPSLDVRQDDRLDATRRWWS